MDDVLVPRSVDTGSAIAASALYNLMLHVAPRPRTYYGCPAGLGTALLVLLPFTTGEALASQVGTARLNPAVGWSSP